MWKRNNPSSFHETKGKGFKEKVEHHGLGSHGMDASKEHKSDLTIETGNPISHRGVYNPPVPFKMTRPRSPSASDMDVMSKRPAIIPEGPKPSILYRSPVFPLEPNQPSRLPNMIGGAHSSGDKYLTNGGYLSRSCGPLNDSLCRSSISGYQISETNITNSYTPHGGTSLINAPEVLSCKWENSVPFRPSFTWPKIDSSPQTPYDPLVDSINPPDNADSEEMKISPENSPTAASNNLSGIGENSPDYNQSNNLHKVKQKMALLEEASFAMNSSKDRTDSDRSWPARPGNRELAEFKMFRVALAECIKELVKPAWKNGILTIDEHRILVKRASDKIISSVHPPHQVPNTHESVKQYISTYRPKIEKLVEGYLDMYSKNNRSTKQDNEVSCIGSSA